jgi:hypothetical protein
MGRLDNEVRLAVIEQNGSSEALAVGQYGRGEVELGVG